MQEDAHNLQLLTAGVHSREALEVVKEHVKNVMGPAAIAYSNTMLKMSKLQAAQVIVNLNQTYFTPLHGYHNQLCCLRHFAVGKSLCHLRVIRIAQVYATSIMFGYFVRKVDKRFQLERSLGLLKSDASDAVDRLERLFSQVQILRFCSTTMPGARSGRCRCHVYCSLALIGALACPQTAEIDVAADPDAADSFSAVDPDKAPVSPEPETESQPRPEKKGVLRDYIESFDQQTLADTARCVIWHCCLSTPLRGCCAAQ